MKQFKMQWEITHNWQLLFPLLGLLALLYLGYKLALLFTASFHFIVTLLVTLLIFYGLLKFVLYLFKKLKNRWAVNARWELIRVFIVFAITGSTSAYIGKPILAALHITKAHPGVFLYWIIRILILFVVYQILLVTFAWLLGQFTFFWEFEKKMLKRIGFKKLLN